MADAAQDHVGDALHVLDVYREAGPEPAVARFVHTNGGLVGRREWAVELAPGESAVILGFIAQVDSFAAAHELAASLLPPDAGALEGLDAEETSRALNFPSLH